MCIILCDDSNIIGTLPLANISGEEKTTQQYLQTKDLQLMP